MLNEIIVTSFLIGASGLNVSSLAARGSAAAAPLPPQQATEIATPTRITVEEAVNEGLGRNPELRAERERVGIAEANRIGARLRPNPLLSASADHLDLLGTSFTEANGGGPAELTLRGDMDWQQGGKRARRIAVADRERDVARGDVADRSRRLAFEIQSAFVDLLRAQETLTLARENLAGFRRVAEISAARVKSGDLAEVELMRTRVALVQLQNGVHRAELARRLAQSRLQLLLGRPAASASSLEAAGGFRSLPAAGVPAAEALVQAAVDRRPDLQAAVAEGARSKAELVFQQSLSKIDLALGAEYRRQQGVNGTSNSLGFFISAPLPVFDRNQGGVARARVEARQAHLRLDAAR
ncbi:MAG: TolC family protein, partial [Acidobacteria bacterium]